jgi:hypothetical protein
MRANGYNHSPEGRETRRRSGDWVTNDVENLQQVAPSAGEAVSGSDVGTTVIEVTRSLRTGSSFSSDAADEQNQPSGRPSRRIKPVRQLVIAQRLFVSCWELWGWLQRAHKFRH